MTPHNGTNPRGMQHLLEFRPRGHLAELGNDFHKSWLIPGIRRGPGSLLCPRIRLGRAAGARPRLFHVPDKELIHQGRGKGKGREWGWIYRECVIPSTRPAG